MGISNNVYEEFEDNKSGDQNPEIKESQSTQWAKKAQKDKQRSTNQYTVNYGSNNTSPT